MGFAIRFFAVVLLVVGVCASPGLAAAQQVGTLISADPVQDTPAGMQAWRIAYWTRNAAGRKEQVTGMVVAPRARTRLTSSVTASREIRLALKGR